MYSLKLKRIGVNVNPANSIVGDSKYTKESTVSIIIIIIIIIITIIIINELKWNVYIIYNYPPKGRRSE